MLLKGQNPQKKARRGSTTVNSTTVSANSQIDGTAKNPSAKNVITTRSSSAFCNSIDSSNNNNPRSAPIGPPTTRSRINQHQQPIKPPQNGLGQIKSPGAQRLLVGSTTGNGGQMVKNPINHIAQRGLNITDLGCDNSNDSGLGFEERQQQLNGKATIWNNGASGLDEDLKKRRKMDIKLESEDANFAFPEDVNGTRNDKISSRNGVISRPSVSSANSIGRIIGVTRPRQAMGVLSKRPPPAHQGPITLTSQLSSLSRNGKTQLQMIIQPEQQHRARYQTEGSRGAVKDRSGNGFPIVRLVGYDKPATLQIFIGTDLGRVAPHMFYQACRVSGKNSTPCVERKIDGTIVIEVDMDPSKEMVVTCDCVGILKERNVDVEHRFPAEAGVLQGRSKKKSTRCRMVFRTTIAHGDGTQETLQVCSQPIVCTQPPGIPEICKKSLTSCPCTGGQELFVIGKNFLKDTKIVFSLDDKLVNGLERNWTATVNPDKEFLQQTHLVCVVPPFGRQDLAPAESISVKLYAVSSGKTSEPHTFAYTAATAAPEPSLGKVDSNNLVLTSNGNDAVLATKMIMPKNMASNVMLPQAAKMNGNFLGSLPNAQSVPTVQNKEILKHEVSSPPHAASNSNSVSPVVMWNPTHALSASNDAIASNLSTSSIVARQSPNMQLMELKSEILDDNSQSSLLSDNSLSAMTNHPLSNQVSNSVEHLVNESSRDAKVNMAKNLVSNGSPVAEMLGVVDVIRSPHPLSLVTGKFPQLPESTQVSIMNSHIINGNSGPLLVDDTGGTGAPRPSGVVDLRMKQSEFNGIGNGNLGSFAATPANQPLPAQSGHSVEKYFDQIECVAPPPKQQELPDTSYSRSGLIAGTAQASLFTPVTGSLDALVNSAVDQAIISPIAEQSSQQHSKTMLDNLIPAPLIDTVSSVVSSNVPVIQEPALLSNLNVALMQDPILPASAAGVATQMQVSSDAMPNSIQQAIQEANAIQQQVQVEQVVAQVEQVVAQAHQQAVQAVQQAQQQVVQQVVQHAQVVQKAVQKVQAVQQVPAAPAVQQAVQQATQEVVQQAVQQATQEVVQQVQAVQQAVQHAQAAQAMQQAVQQDIGSVLSQPAGFVAEASSALASGAAQEPSQQQLTNAAEVAINSVITNATQDIINNKPITTTTAHAIIATKNILNSVATQSAQLMNDAMEGILPKSPNACQNVVDQQVAAAKTVQANVPIHTSRPMEQESAMTNEQMIRSKQQHEAAANGMLQQELSNMADTDLFNYIDANCFDPQTSFLM